MLIIEQVDNTDDDRDMPNPSWKVVTGVDGVAYPLIRDTNGDLFGIGTHRIDSNGAVFPSVVCAYGCGFHEFIKLNGWANIPEPKQH